MHLCIDIKRSLCTKQEEEQNSWVHYSLAAFLSPSEFCLTCLAPSAVVPLDEGRDALCRLAQALFRFVREDKPHVRGPEVIATPGDHRRGGDVLFLQQPLAELPGGDAQRADVGDEEVATFGGVRLQSGDGREPLQQDVPVALVGGDG